MEKIGLPSMLSVRGATWEVDAPHCQGCSVQFTFFTRKVNQIRLAAMAHLLLFFPASFVKSVV